MSDKNDRWNKYSESIGLPKVLSHPPIDSLLKKMGFNLKPLLFWNPLMSIFGVGVIFSTMLMILFLFPFVNLDSEKISSGIICAVFGGLVAGLLVALNSWWIKWRRKIPSWDKI